MRGLVPPGPLDGLTVIAREDHPIPAPLLDIYAEAVLRTAGVELLAEPG